MKQNGSNAAFLYRFIFQKMISEGKRYMFNMFNKKCGNNEKSFLNLVIQGTLSPLYHTPEKLSMPLNKLPCFFYNIFDDVKLLS